MPKTPDRTPGQTKPTRQTKKTRPTRPKQDRRLLLLDTTLRLIAERGVDGVTHRRVAEAAGVPLGSTTYYFESRLHLLREAFDHYLELATSLQRRVGDDVPIRDVDDVVDFLVALTQREFEDESLLLAEYELTLFAARDEAIAASLHRWDDAMIREIARALRSIGTPHPRDSARTLLHLLRGYELDRLTRHAPDPKGLRRRLRRFLEG